jgi:predicted phage baseplate assembly protein
MNLPCGCCEGTQALTPQLTANRPGLSALSYRVGTHATFFETMKARLSSSAYPQLAGLKTRDPGDPAIALLDAWATVADVLTFYQERIANEGYLRTATERRSILELARLVGYALRPGVSASVYLAYTLDKGSASVIPAGSRAQSVPGPGEKAQSFETSDPLQARADWNNLAPRSTRPQRITPANAGTIDTLYLDGTATNLKPNDALLFVFGAGAGQPALRWIKTVEVQSADKRTKVTLQVSPGAQDLVNAVGQVVERYLDLQAFCVSPDDAPTAQVVQAMKNLQTALASTTARAAAVSQAILKLQNIQASASAGASLAWNKWIKGLMSDLTKIATEFANLATDATGSTGASQPIEASFNREIPPTIARLTSLIGPLSLAPSLQPANSLRLTRDAQQTFEVQRDTTPQLLSVLQPRVASTIYQAWANAVVTRPATVQVYALRVKAPLFGYNAGPKFVTPQITARAARPRSLVVDPAGWTPGDPGDETASGLFLDNAYDSILAGDQSFVVVKRSDSGASKTIQILNVQSAATRPRTAFGVSGKTTALTLSGNWWDPSKDSFDVIRDTLVYAQSELLTLAEEPIESDVCSKQIELGFLADSLQSGRWVIVSGERTDIPNTSSVRASELVMLAGIQQGLDPTLPGDKVHSTLILANGLAYTYKRDTVTVYGNVVKATHGETRNEVLGSGDATQALQRFTLKQPPLTYISAPTRDGIASTLQVLVNDIEWHEADSLVGLGLNDRKFITRTDDDSKTTVIFGNGQRGARLPTGVENVRAVYRNGIGRPGNVKAETITLLATKPLGVKEVVNPLRASGGADREGPDQARRNTPLPTMALDRLVSVQDYADFARTFGGVGKASAVRLSDGQRQLVHVTIAGADDIPIDVTSDLYSNLRQALRKYGDPYQPIQVAVRELLVLVISANVQLLPDYQWESVEPKLRAALLDAFSFERRSLGQSVFLSEVISVIQQVAGVAYVDVDILDKVSEKVTADDLVKLSKQLKRNDTIAVQLARPNPVQVADPARRILPAQLAYLTPDIPDTLILKELTA